ncbi:hypothetical protein GS429_04320 [Natronorubrum sp. JWXQ-INN-674]|uniref:Uncharacterized protein n=1 Tax=Natronorubrum halalkaliphilum TaxID=2691917 RepID=A0A6B0VHI5_9EURY|nr:hypothetical protein [Natronorubrum halalkaliphilum]MXV61301.1 hypothetical protein [Natronorubrum halalkaliphilum]
MIGLLLATVAGGLWELPAVLLAIKLNVFAIPLALAGVFGFPLWTWYVISLMWASQLLYYTGTDIPETIDRLREWERPTVPIGPEAQPIETETHEPE